MIVGAGTKHKSIYLIKRTKRERHPKQKILFDKGSERGSLLRGKLKKKLRGNP
jgi:hypothetical protein